MCLQPLPWLSAAGPLCCPWEHAGPRPWASKRCWSLCAWGQPQSSATVQPRDSRPSPSRSVGVALRLAPEALSLLPTAGRTCWPAPPPQLLGPLPPKLSAPESVGFQGDSKQSHAPAQEKCSLAHTVISYGNCAKSTAPFTSPTLGFSQARQVPLLWRGLR